MATTPITITLRANEWSNIALGLSYLADHCDSIGYINSAAEARRYMAMITKRIEESA